MLWEQETAGSNPAIPTSMFHTYALLSITTKKIYTGQTKNIEDRLQRHNNSRSKSTKNKGPWKLIFEREFTTRSESVRLERKLKSFKNREYLFKWIQINQVSGVPMKSGRPSRQSVTIPTVIKIPSRSAGPSRLRCTLLYILQSISSP